MKIIRQKEIIEEKDILNQKIRNTLIKLDFKDYSLQPQENFSPNTNWQYAIEATLTDKRIMGFIKTTEKEFGALYLGKYWGVNVKNYLLLESKGFRKIEPASSEKIKIKNLLYKKHCTEYDPSTFDSIEPYNWKLNKYIRILNKGLEERIKKFLESDKIFS